MTTHPAPIELVHCHHTFRFATASELRDALLAALDEGRAIGQPWLRTERDDVSPAWLWVGALLRRRTDWRECVGVALQQAAVEGDDLVRRALVDLLACETVSCLLHPWTAPLADHLGPIEGTRSATGWGKIDGSSRPRLDRVMADQGRYRTTMSDPSRPASTRGADGPAKSFLPISDARALELAMASSAKAGHFSPSNWGAGPWSWLNEERQHRAWMDAAIDAVLPRFAGGADPELYALIDWLGDGHDLWRHAQLIDGWIQRRPKWWDKPTKTKPKGWKTRIRPNGWPLVKTLGDAVIRLRSVAAAQAKTPPVQDLPAWP